MASTRDWIKPGDPVFNASGLPVGVVTEVNERSFAFCARDGMVLAPEPLSVVDEQGERYFIPEVGTATYVGDGKFEL